MNAVIGADIGGTCIKLVLADEHGNILNRHTYLNDRDRERLIGEIHSMARENSAQISVICATGIGSGILSGYTEEKVELLSEFECFARAAQELCGVKKALVACIGTGTSFVLADGDQYRYLGGTGVGGGTLMGLCGRLTDTRDYDGICGLIESGNSRNIDLTVGDICIGGSTQGVDPNLTAANFGKGAASGENDCDRAAAAATLVFETVGVMAAFVCKYNGYDTALFAGAPAELEFADRSLKAVSALHGLDFRTVPLGQFAGAIGAVAKYCGHIAKA